MRDHKKREFVTRRSYQGISSFFWKWIYHVFYHFSRLIHKVLWNPSHPNRCCPGKMGEASRLCASDVTWYHNGREILGEGAKGEVTRSALAASALCSLSFSPSSLTCQCSPSSKACLEHIEVQAWSSPFQWCSIRFWDKFSCREYYESKHLGKQSWNEQILSIFLVTFCMLRSERNSSSIFWFTPDHPSVRIDDNSSQIQPEKCRGQQCCLAL